MLKRVCLFALIFICVWGLPPVAAAKPTPGDTQAAAYFRAQTAVLSARCLANVQTLADWQARRARYRREFLEMLGLWPMPKRTALKPVVTGRLSGPGFTVEKLYFQALPHLYVTANLYLPEHLEKPAPAILFECGHLHMFVNGVSVGNKTAYQQHGAWFAQNGYVCLVLDTLQLGEIHGMHTGTRDHGQWWWNSRGYTPAGVEAWFGIRGLDYLCSRPDVDTNRLGVTGHSGGGWYTWMLAALDGRVKAAAPLAGISDLQNQLVDGCVDHNCDCMFFVNTYRWDFPDVAALVAPRPLLIGNEDKDTLFPLDGVLRLYEKTRRIYQLYGASTNLGLVVVEGGHADSPDFLVPVLRWFNRHLKGEDPPIRTLARRYFAPAQLKVFTRIPADEINSNIQQTFVPTASPPESFATATERQKQETAWLADVRRECFGGWPAADGPLELRPAFSAERDGVKLEAVDFRSQHLVTLRLYVAQPAGGAGVQPVILRVLDEPQWTHWLAAMRAEFGGDLTQELQTAVGGAPATDPQRFDAIKRELQAGKSALAWFAPRGVGLTAFSPGNKNLTHIRRRFMLLGQTLDGMRVWDIRRAVEALRAMAEFKAAPLSLRASGAMGENALYAALFEPGIARLELSALPATQADGPDYLNVMRIWHLSQAEQTARDRMEVTRR